MFFDHHFGPSFPGISSKIRALAALRNVIYGAFGGTLDQKYHVSSVDPGLGKSTTLITILRERKAAGILHDSGIVIFTQSKKEIAAFVALAQGNELPGQPLEETDFAVFIGEDDDGETDQHEAPDQEPTDLGSAPVLFTTHAMLRSRSKNKLFSELDCFRYQGAARPARVWDEGFRVAVDITISVKELRAAELFYDSISPRLVGELAGLQKAMEDTPAGHYVEVPDLVGFLALGVANDRNSGISKDARKLLNKLIDAAGIRFNVVQKTRNERIIVGCSQPLPGDIKPLIIMDASARVNPGYLLFGERTGEVSWLPQAVNDYRNLTVNVWTTSISNDTLRFEPEPILDRIINLVCARPNEEWLVFYKKRFKGLCQSIKKTLPKGVKVHFLHWGIHKATNEFRHVSNLILIGPQFYGQHAFTPIYMATMGSTDEPGDKVSIAVLKEGAFKDDLLQAVCRGSIRNVGDDGIGHSSTVHLITSPNQDVEETVREVFPGCVVNGWAPVAKGLSKRPTEVLKAILPPHTRDRWSFSRHLRLDRTMPEGSPGVRARCAVASRSNGVTGLDWAGEPEDGRNRSTRVIPVQVEA